ncbi:MAG: hypothetical protein ABI852_02065 [Gemmatimonadaceae bacterium]
MSFHKHRALVALAAVIALSGFVSNANAQSGNPSRAAIKGCKWERASDKIAGLAAWVQRCDYGDRKIHLYFKGNALMQQYSDATAPDTLIESFELLPNESAEAGVRRVYLAHALKIDAGRCVIAPYKLGKAQAGSVRYEFVPNAAYAKEVKKKADPMDMPDPPCGDWGTAVDGQQYFQVWPTGTARRLLFVRLGQDEALFDEMTLELLATVTKPKTP